MKFKSLFFKSILCVSLGLPVVLWFNASVNAETESVKTVSPHQFDVIPEIFAYSYKEWSNKKPFMSLNGLMFALGGSYSYNFGKNFVKLSSRFAMGDAKYKSKSTGRNKNDPSWYIDSQAVYGHHFDLSSNLTISPYLGLGYRFLENDGSNTKTTTGHYGYLRESQYLYIPIGSDLTIPIDSKLSFVVNAEYDLFLNGLQKSHTHSSNGIGGLIENKQSRGYGLRAAAGLRWTLEKMAIEAKPFFRYWSIADSKKVHQTTRYIKATFSEPKNATKEVGLGITFKF
ncbi:MAG: hypothetical protein Q8K40_02640 [Ignavibacteria bacterium]|nr:hypothetical protein [Ignavibacteria bacterium]